MTAPHIPVLLDEVIAALDPQPGDVVVDATFGAGGYTRAILQRGDHFGKAPRWPRPGSPGSTA